MEFRVLGPLAVVAGGEEVQLGAAKRAALLVRLLLDANRPVAPERLVDDLWEGDPPRSAAQTLQTYVSQLRKALGVDRLVTVPGGYQLVVEENELDSTVFESTLASARRALGASDPARAANELRVALAGWRGTALSDAVGASWALAEVARLEELRLVATELLIEANVEAGDNTAAIAAAESAVAEQPLRERLWGLLMTALYRDGRTRACAREAARSYGASRQSK